MLKEIFFVFFVLNVEDEVFFRLKVEAKCLLRLPWCDANIATQPWVNLLKNLTMYWVNVWGTLHNQGLQQLSYPQILGWYRGCKKVHKSWLTPRYWDGTEGTQKLSHPQIFSAKLNFLLQDVISEISAMKIFILKYSKDLRVYLKHIFDMGRRERTCVAPPAFPRWWSEATWAPAPGSVADGT